MTGAQVGVVCAVIVCVVTVLGFTRSILKSAKDRETAEKERADALTKERTKEKAEARGEGFAAGAVSRDIEVLRIQNEAQRFRDQRDEARRERDAEKERADRLERRLFGPGGQP